MIISEVILKFCPWSSFLSVIGHWTGWTNWSNCTVFPIDRSRKFSNRTRTCVCNNCNNYCIGKDFERKICSCADGYRMGENEWLPCIKASCLQLQPVVGQQGKQFKFVELHYYFPLVRYYDVEMIHSYRPDTTSRYNGRYQTDGQVNGHVR